MIRQQIQNCSLDDLERVCDEKWAEGFQLVSLTAYGMEGFSTGPLDPIRVRTTHLLCVWERATP